jgi:RNAse (barnase) inhibitor barstar
VVVLAHQPHAADPARYDIVLGAAIDSDDAGIGSPTRPWFELFAGPAAASLGRCDAVDGLFAARADPTPVPLHLIGCEPAEPLLGVLRRPGRWERDGASLLALDRHGAVMASHTVGLAIGAARPSVLGGTLVDITLIDGGDDRPVPAVRPVWAAWYQGPPTETNLWARYDGRGRAAWLDLAPRGWRVPAPRPDRTGGVHNLDGRFVTDVAGLHCALAEALLGPGRYFGRGWDALQDCLCGGFGVAPPFTLVWHDSAVARRALAEVVDDPENRLCYFDDVVHLLERCGVTVTLR